MGTANIFDISDANGRHGYETTVDWIENNYNNADGYIVKLGETLNGTPTLDDNFIENINAVEKYNKPFGIYYVNHFLNDEIPSEEAEFVNNMIYQYIGENNPHFTLGIWADLEVESTKNYNADSRVQTFLDSLIDWQSGNPGGLYGIYAGYSYLNSEYVSFTTIKEKGYLIWVAQYNTENSLLLENPDLEENIKIWQFTTNNNTLDQSTMYNV